MKQIFSALAVIVMIISSKNSGAQTNNEVAFNNSTSTVNLSVKSPDKKKFETKATYENVNFLRDMVRSFKNVSETKVTNVNIKAVRDFTRSYKNISEAKWLKTEGGYIATFFSNGIDTKIIYDNKGRWFYNFFTYTEAKLSFNIRDMVKSKYYDDDIIIVFQYELNNKTVYIIRMQDKQSNIKTLKICDGEMEDITQHEKN